ncbi:ATP-binding protein [Halosimplex pelagicum]|uniref:ATP-binding protein n=1 Tax=Halosimplex pelagicum TaxID=869886 RepID=A0A7D5PGU2_9EURY|nr:ATP-binding protein [Halosimplex pelagicum]QLH84800.1 ATP-binding protein [Halosimplex pelagicum]
MSGSAPQNNAGSLIEPDQFIKSIRENGINTNDAVNEFIDNSFDADSNTVAISIVRDNNELSIIVEDDGEGIPPDQMEMALRFGGQIPGRTDTTGRFGFGLPASALCQSNRVELYTRSESDSGNSFRFCYLDEEYVRKNNSLPDEEKDVSLPDEYDYQLDKDRDTGTTLILKDLRSPDRKTASGLLKYLRQDLSEVHRHLINEGKKITINGERIRISDPLMLMDGSMERDRIGKGDEWASEEIEVDIGEFKDDQNPPKIKYKLVILPVEELYTESHDDFGDLRKPNQDNQGFYVTRKDRQIGSAETLHLFTRHNNYNYFRAEIQFGEELDDYFGVQTNKSRFALDADLRDLLENEVVPQLSDIVDEINDRKAKIDQRGPEYEGMSQSERIFNEATDWMSRSGHDPDEELVRKQKKEAKSKLREIEEDESIPRNKRRQLKEKYELLRDKDNVFFIDIDETNSSEFFEVEHKGKMVTVKINPKHDFYQYMYSSLEQDPSSATARTYVDVLLLMLAKAEDEARDENLQRFYRSQRRSWSRILADLIDEKRDFFESN